MPYYVYIIQSQKDASYYVGSTQDLIARLERHNQGRSKYTKTKIPWDLVYKEEYPDRSSAVLRETEVV
jgi:putative endonuclease